MSKVKIKKTNKVNELVKEAQSQEEFDQFMEWVANQVHDELSIGVDTMLEDMEMAIISDQKSSNLFNKNK